MEKRKSGVVCVHPFLLAAASEVRGHPLGLFIPIIIRSGALRWGECQSKEQPVRAAADGRGGGGGERGGRKQQPRQEKGGSEQVAW